MSSHNQTPTDLLHAQLTLVMQCFALPDLHDAAARPVEQASARADELLRAVLDRRPADPRPLLEALSAARRAWEPLGGVLHQAELALATLSVDAASAAPAAPRPMDPRLAELLVGLVDALALLRYPGPPSGDTRPWRVLRALVERTLRRALAGDALDADLEELARESARIAAEHGAEAPARRVREALALLEAPAA